MAEPHLRAARASDLPAVAHVFLACWRGPYAAFLPRRLATRHDEASALALWRPRLEPTPDVGLVVAELSGSLVGVALVHPEASYLASLYVDPAVHGRGVGRLLFTQAASVCRGTAADRMTWWVFADNRAGRDFYERLGAAPTGRMQAQEEFGLPEAEYAVDLAP